MSEEEQAPWFVFTVQDVPGIGVEIPKLTRLLGDLSSALFAIARANMGGPGPRPGRRTSAEEMSAAFRLVRVVPGSTTIELAPPASGHETQMSMFETPAADDIAMELYREVERIYSREPPAEGRSEVRRRVVALIHDAAQIGPRVEITYRPRSSVPERKGPEVLKRSFDTGDIPEIGPVSRSGRVRRLSGHTYMVDVEPGRQRMRIKLPDGRDLTVEVDEDVADKMAAAVNRVVELGVREELEGEVVARRIALDVQILPSSVPGADVPPKSISELEVEQGLASARPDYVSLASSIWRTSEDLRDFEKYMAEIRVAAED